MDLERLLLMRRLLVLVLEVLEEPTSPAENPDIQEDNKETP